MQFDYRAYKSDGKIVKGQIEAEHEKDAIDRLGSQDLLVVELKKHESIKKTVSKVKGRVPLPNLTTFTRQLATMLRAGLPLLKCLTGLQRQVKHEALRAILQYLVTAVENGASLSQALAQHPRTFSSLYISMVAAGEKGGVLPEILDRLAGYLEASLSLRQKVRSAIAYPAIVSIMAIGICIFLITTIIPVFADIYKDFQHGLPKPTLVLIQISDMFRTHYLKLLVGVVVLGLTVRRLRRTPQGTWFWDRTKLRFPIFGVLAQKIVLSRFSRTYATLTHSGVPILETLRTVAKAADNVVVDAAVTKIVADIESGNTLLQAMERQEIFPPMLLEMVAAGEQTGSVDEMLAQVADHYDREIEAALAGLTALIEPLLILFLGVVVGSVVVAMFLPIFNISQIVQF